MNKTIFLVYALMIGCAVCFFENDQLVKPITTLEQYESITSGKEDRVSIVVYWHEDSPKTTSIEEQIYDLAETNEGYFSVFQIDCEFFSTEEISFCGHEDTVAELPIVQLFVPPQQKINPITKKQNEVKELKYSGSLDAKSIFSFAQPHMPNYSITQPTLKQLQEKILPNRSHVKVLLFTNKAQTAPLFKALSAIYRYRLKFVEIHQTQTDIIQQFKIDKFPTLMIVRVGETGQVEGIRFQDQFKVTKIQSFLDLYALKEKLVVEDDLEGKPNKANTGSDKNFQSAFDEEDDKKDTDDNKVEELKPTRYEKTLLQEESIVILHVYTDKEKSHPEFLPLKEKLAELSKYYEFIADTPEKLAFAENTLNIKSYPSIRMYPFSAEKKTNSKYIYGPNITNKTIVDEIDEITDDESVSVQDDKTFQMMISSALQESKIIQILFHAKPRIPLAFRVATKVSEFQKKFRFLNFRNAPSQILQQFSIQKVPRVAVVFRNVNEEEKDTPIKPEQVQATQFSGKLNYKDYSQFLNVFLAKGDSSSSKSKKKITEIVTQQDLENVCKKKTRICFIALLNGDPALRKNEEDDDESEQLTKLQQQLKIYEEVKDKVGDRPITFGWIDAVCHPEIIAELEIYEDNLPNYILYNASQKQFSPLIGRFEVDNLESFTMKGLQGKTRLQTIPKELKVSELDCQIQHEKIKKLKEEYEKPSASSAFDDEIQKEILEEERQRKMKINAELKSEKQSSRKRKPKGGKKKQDL